MTQNLDSESSVGSGVQRTWMPGATLQSASVAQLRNSSPDGGGGGLGGLGGPGGPGGPGAGGGVGPAPGHGHAGFPHCGHLIPPGQSCGLVAFGLHITGGAKCGGSMAARLRPTTANNRAPHTMRVNMIALVLGAR